MHDWIDGRTALEDFVAAAGAAPRLALDTEFMRVRTFWPQLALLQLGFGGRVALIDPLALPALDPLAPLLGDAARPVLMHSASEDLVVLAPIANGPVRGLFDTQVAAAYAGLGAGIGYQRLVAEVLGLEIGKDETRSDWLARPLSPKQLAYAEADVQHLEALHDALLERLDRRGMLARCREDCARLAANAADPALPADPHWDFRNGWKLPLPIQARLRELLLWREATARRIDRPRLWLFDNPAAIALVQAPPATPHELGERLRTQKGFPKRELGALFELLSAPLPAVPADFRPIPTPLAGAQEQRFDRLREIAARLAAELDLPAALLAPRRLLEAVVRGEKPPELDGWRGDVLGAAIAAV